jgi:hypothetical protein
MDSETETTIINWLGALVHFETPAPPSHTGVRRFLRELLANGPSQPPSDAPVEYSFLFMQQEQLHRALTPVPPVTPRPTAIPVAVAPKLLAPSPVQPAADDENTASAKTINPNPAEQIQSYCTKATAGSSYRDAALKTCKRREVDAWDHLVLK